MSNTKYEFVPGDEIVIAPGRTLKRIRALTAIALFGVAAGDAGGYVESEANLSVYGDAWVSPLDIIGLRWSVSITDSQMTIGCQSHALHVWESFTDDQISEMDSDALEFWSTHKTFLLGMARATGRSFEPVKQEEAA